MEVDIRDSQMPYEQFCKELIHAKIQEHEYIIKADKVYDFNSGEYICRVDEVYGQQ